MLRFEQEIAFAQTYFALQTRKAELIEQRLLEAEHIIWTVIDDIIWTVMQDRNGGFCLN